MKRDTQASKLEQDNQTFTPQKPSVWDAWGRTREAVAARRWASRRRSAGGSCGGKSPLTRRMLRGRRRSEQRPGEEQHTGTKRDGDFS